jgi:inhibitor of cysteine peptidase
MAGAAVTLTAADNGKVVDVAEGEAIALRLHENAATGYRWEFDGLDRTCVGVEEREHVRQAGAFVASGDAQWLLVPRKPGTVEVRLKRWRRWEGEESVRERFAVTLRIA